LMAAEGFPASSSDLARSKRGGVEDCWANTKSVFPPEKGHHPWFSKEPKVPTTNHKRVRSNRCWSKTVVKGKIPMRFGDGRECPYENRLTPE